MKTVCSPLCLNLILHNTTSIVTWFECIFNFCTFCMEVEDGYRDACNELSDLWRAANV